MFDMMKCFYLVAAFAAIQGCQSQHLVNSDTTGLPILDSAYRHQIHDGFYDVMPNCVAVLPGAHGDHQLLASSLARHLTDKFDKVISPDRLQGLINQNVINPDTVRGREMLARRTGCRSFLTLIPEDRQQVYIITFSMERLGASVQLVGTDGLPMWQAGFVTARSDGGLSIDPLGIAANAAAATIASQDRHRLHSMADDVARMLVSGLPDMRSRL